MPAFDVIMMINKHFSLANQLTVSFLSDIKHPGSTAWFPLSSAARITDPIWQKVGCFKSEGT